MSRAGRTHRLFWIAGIVLLVGTVLGAGYVLNNNNNAVQNPSAPAAAPSDAPPAIVSLGVADVEPGISRLFPVQSGRVTAISEESKLVKKGDVLLKIDNRLAQYRVREAKADVAAARELLRQAERLPQVHKEKVRQQESAILAAQAQKSLAELVLKIKTNAHPNPAVVKNEESAAREKVNMQEALIKVEQSKLEELKLADPQVDIERAHADVAAKEARLEQAELALDECDLRAPSDGMVLRVLVHVGEALSSSSKTPALEFAPQGPKIIRAEVLQEWASKVHEGQEVTIEDDTYAGHRWPGKVKRLSPWFAHKRSVILEPFMFNDVRTLECLVQVTSEEQHPLRIGQRVRVTIQPDGK